MIPNKNNIILLPPIIKKRFCKNILYKTLHLFGKHYWTNWEDITFNRYSDSKVLYLEQIRRCQICNKVQLQEIRSKQI